MKRNLIYLFSFLFLTLLYFHEILTDGILVAPGDGMGLYYPKRMLAKMIADQSPLQLWNPYLFSGFPFLASIESAVLYPLSWIAMIFQTTTAFNLLLIIHYTGAAFFTFLYARIIGAGEIAAFFAGAVFAFLGFESASVPFVTFYATLMWFPLLLYMLEKLRQELNFRYAAFSGLVTGLMLLAGHPQIAFNVLIVIGMFVVYYTIHLERGKRFRFVCFFVFAIAIGSIISLPQIYSTFKLIHMSPREEVTYKFFSAFSYPPHMLPSSVFPFLWGNGYGGSYWGPFTDYKSNDAYFGVLPLLFALFTALRLSRKNMHVRFFAIVGVVAFVLSMGRYLPVHRLLYHVPFFDFFRCPARHMLEVSMSVSLLSALGLSQFLSDNRRPLGRAVLATILALAGGTVLAITVFKEPLHSFVLSSVRPMRPQNVAEVLTLSSPAIYIPLVIMLFYAAWLIAINAGGKVKALKYLIIVIVFADAFIFRQALGTGPKVSHVQDICNEGVIGFLTERNDGRVAFLHEKLQPLQGAMCGLRMIDGFEQLVVKDYNELLGLETSGAYTEWTKTAARNATLSMLNTKYLVVSPQMEGFVSNVRGKRVSEGEVAETEKEGFRPPFVFLPYPYGDIRYPVYRKIYSDVTTAVYENLNVLPLAYSVRNLRPVSSTQDALEYMHGEKFDPRSDALLAYSDIKTIGESSFKAASVSVRAYYSGKAELETSSSGPSFIVLSEQYYPGWKAFVDGKESSIYRTNGILKGVFVPSGKHEITFIYRPLDIYATLIVSFLTFCALCAALIKFR